MKTFVLSELRLKYETAVLERIESEFYNVYRVTIVRRLPSLKKAKEAYLSALPPKTRKRLEKQIDEAMKQNPSDT